MFTGSLLKHGGVMSNYLNLVRKNKISSIQRNKKLFKIADLKISLIFVFLLSIIHTELAFSYKKTNSDSCEKIVQELKDMKEATKSINSSLIYNHDLMADSLESYSDALKSSAGKAYKSVESNMIKAADSLRGRGKKAEQLNDKMLSAIDELINKAEACLK